MQEEAGEEKGVKFAVEQHPEVQRESSTENCNDPQRFSL